MANTTGQVMPDGSVQYYEDAMGRAMVSTDYDPTSSYAVGYYCIYDNTRYCCNTAIASGGETWNSAHWDVAKVDDDITEIKSSLSNLGTFYTYSWSAGSSNAYGQQLTQKLTLPKGVYILIGVSPVISVNECAIALTSNKTMNAPFVFNIVRARTPLAYTFQITEDNTDVWIMSGGSASITYTAIGDASGRIIRVG